MREGISNHPNSSGTSSRIVWSGAILVTVGLSLLLLAGEWFAGFNACVANPTCNAGAPPSTLETYLALMVVGGRPCSGQRDGRLGPRERRTATRDDPLAVRPSSVSSISVAWVDPRVTKCRTVWPYRNRRWADVE